MIPLYLHLVWYSGVDFLLKIHIMMVLIYRRRYQQFLVLVDDFQPCSQILPYVFDPHLSCSVNLGGPNIGLDSIKIIPNFTRRTYTSADLREQHLPFLLHLLTVLCGHFLLMHILRIILNNAFET